EGKVQIQLYEVDLNECIADIIKEMKPITEKNQVIEYTYEGDGNIISDKKLLKNILINLMSNAIKFSRDEGKIFISGIIGKSTASISIKDHGIGIGEDDQLHLFSSFFRGGNATNIQGTGL